MNSSWRRLGTIEPDDLVEGRLLLHHASQLVTAAGRSLLDPRPDDGQTAFEWREDLQSLVGETIPGETRWRAALRPADLTLLVLDEGGESAEALLLAGRNLDTGFAWLRERAGDRGADTGRLSRDVPYAMPEHAVARGAAFPPSPLPAFAELARYFSNSSRLFLELAAGRPRASKLRCWPHHFDLGGTLSVDPPTNGHDSPTVGFGLSPGDDGVAEPYWYVSLSPHPARLPDPLPPLENARWNLEGWLGAVLPGSAVAAARTAAEQEANVRRFLTGAVNAATDLLGGRRA
jgi:hypothetical protein